jgi:hypothetical protein
MHGQRFYRKVPVNFRSPENGSNWRILGERLLEPSPVATELSSGPPFHDVWNQKQAKNLWNRRFSAPKRYSVALPISLSFHGQWPAHLL